VRRKKLCDGFSNQPAPGASPFRIIMTYVIWLKISAPSLISQPEDSIIAMASTGMSKDAAVMISLALEGILYGEYHNRLPCPMPGVDPSLGFSIFMFLGTIHALSYNRRINRPSLVVAVLLLILSTAVSASCS